MEIISRENRAKHLDYNLVSKAMDLSEYAGTHLMLGFWLYKDLSTVVSSCGKKDGLYVESLRGRRGDLDPPGLADRE